MSVDCNKNGSSMLAWVLGLRGQLFSLPVSNTHPIACSRGLQNSRGRKVIRGTSAVLLLLNGPLSSGCAETRAFSNPNIRGRQAFHKSRLLSGWEHHRRRRTSSVTGDRLKLFCTFLLSPEGVEGRSFGQVRM